MYWRAAVYAAALAAIGMGCEDRPRRDSLPEPRMQREDSAAREAGRDVGGAMRRAGESARDALEGVKEGVEGHEEREVPTHPSP
jgi:hypothetical protein